MSGALAAIVEVDGKPYKVGRTIEAQGSTTVLPKGLWQACFDRLSMWEDLVLEGGPPNTYSGSRFRELLPVDAPPTTTDYFEAKHDQGKTRWDLLPWDSLEGVAEVLTFGAAKYDEDSWREVPDGQKRYFAAMLRHWRAMRKGETIDPESGLPHRHHFLCNAAFLCELEGE